VSLDRIVPMQLPELIWAIRVKKGMPSHACPGAVLPHTLFFTSKIIIYSDSGIHKPRNGGAERCPTDTAADVDTDQRHGATGK
jgi:hypothetical protein